MVEQHGGGDRQRQRGGLHGELTLVEQEHHAQQHQHGNKDAHGRRAGRIDLAHELAREREEHAETEQPPAEGRKARPLAAHHGEHHARADQRRADPDHRVEEVRDRHDLVDGALDKILVDEQKIKFRNEAGGEERQGAVQAAVILGDARFALGIVLFCCHLYMTSERFPSFL